jgi:hypothetical protein
MTLGGLSHDAGLLGRAHCLPATAVNQRLLPIFGRRSFGDKQIGTFCKFSDGIAWADISCKHNHAIRRFKTIGMGLVLAGCRVLMESKMAVFDGRHLYVRVLKNHPGTDVITEEQLGYRYGAASISNPDLGTYGEILHGGLNQLCCSGRAIDVDRLRTLSIPRNRQRRTKTGCVIVMMMRNENDSDLPGIDTSLRKTARGAVAGINDIMRAR